MTESFIPAHGGYEQLASYQKAQIVYDATVAFCNRFLSKRDRTVDQMIQAARSGKQNIVEGSMASGTSKQTELKLTNVARASLEELLEDYRDFLRVRKAPLWSKESKEALYVRRLSSGKIHVKNGTEKTDGNEQTKQQLPGTGNHRSNSSHQSHNQRSPITFEAFRCFFETRPPEVLANIVICLIHQTNFLLDRQIAQLEIVFLKEGGLRERMTQARLSYRRGLKQ